jgi:serine/threonine protein phosphatase PrpC
MDTEAPWQGTFREYTVGDPGRAPARVVPRPDLEHPRRPDTVVDGFTITDGTQAEIMRVRAASLRGLSHRCYGKVRQDEYAWRTTANGHYLVICVADGVSAGELSHIAAERAATTGTAELCAQLTHIPLANLLWSRVLDVVAHDIVETAKSLLPEGEPVAEHMATTVLYAVIDLVPTDNGHEVYLLSVGDTSAWVLLEDGRWCPQQPVKNENEDLYSPAVHALPILSTTAIPVRTWIRPGQALVLMTDGIGDPLADGTGEVGHFLANAWREPPPDLAFAAQAAFARKSYDDDRTAVALWPVPRGEPAFNGVKQGP